MGFAQRCSRRATSLGTRAAPYASLDRPEHRRADGFVWHKGYAGQVAGCARTQTRSGVAVSSRGRGPRMRSSAPGAWTACGSVLLVGRRGDRAARDGELLVDRLGTPTQTVAVRVDLAVADVLIDERDDQCCRVRPRRKHSQTFQGTESPDEPPRLLVEHGIPPSRGAAGEGRQPHLVREERRTRRTTS
jgi:hypothetical protein